MLLFIIQPQYLVQLKLTSLEDLDRCASCMSMDLPAFTLLNVSRRHICLHKKEGNKKKKMKRQLLYLLSEY